MIRFETRPEPSRAMSLLSPLLALAITVLIGEWMSGLWDGQDNKEKQNAEAGTAA